MERERIGKYEILGLIGEGAMGRVYRARDPLLRRDVALKTISGALAADPVFQRRFRREAQAAARLNHPNVVTIFDYGEQDGGVTYIAMELLEGTDLRAALRTGELSTLERKLAIMLQLADGLAFAHARGVVHRDVKPGNVHLLPNGEVKILDFGLARLAASDITAAGAVLGTPYYMSPEQVRGESVDCRSDVFSFGAVCHEILTGARAFDGRSLHEVLGAIVHDEPPPIRRLAEDTPEPVASVVERCLRKDPAARFANAGEVAAALAGEDPTLLPAPAATILQAQPAATVVPPAPAVKPSRRSPRVLVLAAGGVAAAALVTGALVWRNARSSPAPSAPRLDVLSDALITSRLELARSDLDGRDYAASIEHARAALALDPSNREAGELLRRARDARRELDGAVDQARSAYGRGDMSAAAAALERVLALDPRSPVAGELSGSLDRHFRTQAEQARLVAREARKSAELASAGSAALGPGAALVMEADALFRRERYAPAAQKYLEARTRFDVLRRAAAAARAPGPAPDAGRRAVDTRAVATSRPLPLPPTPAATALPPSGRADPLPPPPAQPASPPAAPSAAPEATATTATASPASLPPTPRVDEESRVRQVIDAYARAIERRDVAAFRTLMPDLTSEGEKRLRDAFAAVQSHSVGISVEGVQVAGDEATVRVLRQDAVNGRSQKPLRQVFRLTRRDGSWRIASMSAR